MIFSDRRWKAVKITPPMQNQTKDGPNIVISTVPGIVIYQLTRPYSTREQVLIYRGTKGWVAQLTGSEGKDVTDRLSQERWDELYSGPQAVLAMTGDISKLPTQEIF
jgi:hypothetical protein